MRIMLALYMLGFGCCCVMPPSTPNNLVGHISDEEWEHYRQIQIAQLRRNGGCPKLLLESHTICNIESRFYVRLRGQCRKVYGVGTCVVFNTTISKRTMIWPGHRTCNPANPMSRRIRYSRKISRTITTEDRSRALSESMIGTLPEDDDNSPMDCYVPFRNTRNVQGKCVLLNNGQVYACQTPVSKHMEVLHPQCASLLGNRGT